LSIKIISSLSTVSIASFVLFSAISGCSSDDKKTSSDAGSGGQTGSGGNTGSGGGASGGGTQTGDSGAKACTLAVGTSCDGKEDCPSGQRCCGKYDQTGYTEFGCFASCAALAGDAGGAGFGSGPLWFELCNPKDGCEDTTATCSTSRYLPGSLSRCLPSQIMGATSGTPDATLKHDKDAVNCGKSVCGATEQCCVRQPLEPYCAPKGATCDCAGPAKGPDGGHSGAGGADAGSAGGSPSTDAGRDASTRD
jgi:hypothetical protein